MQKLLKRLEKADFNVTQSTEHRGIVYEAQQHTPAGEDWSFSFSTVEEFVSFAIGFDVDEEFEFWINATCSGKPKPSELLQDQKWKKKLLLKISRGL